MSLSPPSASAQAPSVPVPLAPSRFRLDFLDGIRGLAALYVALFHVSYARQSLPEPARHLTDWLQFGHYAVGVFIVLSGYCLMLPVARSADGRLRGGVGSYLRRRAWRILPPYYAALVLALALVA